MLWCYDEFIMTFKLKKREKFRYLLSNSVRPQLKNSPEKELQALCRLASTVTCSHISNLCHILNIWHILLLPWSIKLFSIKQPPKFYFSFFFFSPKQECLLAFLPSTHGSYKATFIPACQVLWGPQVEAVNKVKKFLSLYYECWWHCLSSGFTVFFTEAAEFPPHQVYPCVWNCWCT